MVNLRHPGVIASPRLWLVPLTLPLADAAIAGDRKELAKLLDAEIPEDWPGEGLRENGLPKDRAGIAEDPRESIWRTRLVLARLKEGMALVGTCSLKGPPSKFGAVTIGYEIVPERRNSGYASEASRALVGWAMEQPGVAHVEAYVDKGNEASKAVLRDLGMVRSGMMQSPETGICEVHAMTRDQWLHAVKREG